MNTSPAAPLVVEDPATRSHVITTLPILVLMPHNRCNCRCMMCDIWRIRETREITRADLEPHLTSLRALKVQWIVFSGGEPLMHSDLAGLARWLRGEGIRTTLLTAGLLLEKYAASVTENIDDVIVSLDGPSDVHDKVREFLVLTAASRGVFKRFGCTGRTFPSKRVARFSAKMFPTFDPPFEPLAIWAWIRSPFLPPMSNPRHSIMRRR